MPEPDQPSPQVSSGDASVDPDAAIAKPADAAPAPDTEELLRQAESKAQEISASGRRSNSRTPTSTRSRPSARTFFP
jgi:hypothetical protein